MKKTQITKIKSLKDNAEALAYMVQEVNSWDNSLDGYEYHEFDDDFFDTYFEGKPMDAVRAVFFGDVQNWTDEYIRFNGYGNLESLSAYQRDEELIKGADEIIARFLELAEFGQMAKVDYEHLLKEYK